MKNKGAKKALRKDLDRVLTACLVTLLIGLHLNWTVDYIMNVMTVWILVGFLWRLPVILGYCLMAKDSKEKDRLADFLLSYYSLASK